MNIRKLLCWCVVPLLVVALGAALWWAMGRPNPAQAQASPELHLVSQSLGPSQIVAALRGIAMANLGGFEFDLTTDPAVARLTGVQVGDFLASSGRTVGALGPLLGGQGESLAFGAYSYDPSGQNGPGPSGDGTLAVVTLTVAGDGVTPLTLTNTLFVDVEANPQAVTTADAALQSKTLHGGWNLLAPCVDTAGLEVSRTLESLTGRFSMVLGERGTYVVNLPPEFQSLHEIVPPWAYYVRVQGSDPVTLTQLAPPFDPQTPVPLARGWRWVGYCVGATLPVTVALQSIDGAYDMVLGETGTYVVGLPPEFQSLRELRQAAGYLIRMTQDATLVFPSGAAQGLSNVATFEREHVGTPAPLPPCTHAQVSPYLTLAYGEVWLDGRPAPAGSMVEAVTPRGEVAGCFVVQHAGAFGVMSIYGADADGITSGFREGEAIAWRVNGQPATGTELTWADDKEVHQVRLATDRAGGRMIHLPVIGK